MKDDQRVVLTKRLLQEGVLRLLKKKDIQKINVTELCAESGINRTTFYRHYQQPQDILAEIRYQMFRELNLHAQKNHAMEEPMKWLEYMCQYLYDRAELLNVLFKSRTDDEFIALINELYHEQFEHIRGEGYGKEFDDEELRLAMYYCSGGVYYILRQWITEPVCKTPQEVARIIYRFLIR